MDSVTCISCYAHVRDEGARESLLTDVVEWILSLKGHVLLGGDLNTELHESPALLFLVQRGYRTVNGKGAVTCLASGSSRGSVIDHLLVSPSLWPALQSSDVLSEAPWPTHKPIFAEFEGTAVVDTWHTLLLPRPFPLQGCVPTTDAHVVYQEEFRAISSLTKEGQHCVAYDAWTELAERELMRQCRRNAKDVSRTYCGRAAPPRLRQCQLKNSGEDMCRDACDRRLERVRSGLAELCACWDVCVRENTQHALWANARRRILLVGAPHGECPADLPDRDTVKNWLTWVRAEIERRNKKHRYHAVHDWRERLKYSQADRFVWAKAKHANWQSVHDTQSCFKSIEAHWRPILSKSAVEHPAAHRCQDVPMPRPDVETLASLDLLVMTGSHLRAAVQQTSLRSACGADGWRRFELLALPLPFWDCLASVLNGMASSGDWHPCLCTVVTSLIPKQREADLMSDPGNLRPISVASLVYRAWGRVIAKRIHALLEVSLPSCAHGFRKGESAQSTLAWVFLRCQNSVLSQRPLHVLSYDIRKCFDSLPWDAVRDSLIECGVHRATANALHSHWHALRRIWKLQGRYHNATFNARNGLFQGDPTAPACLAAFLVEPMQHITQVWPMVQASQYADDILLMSHDASSLRDANGYLEGWMRKHGVQFNVGKCHYFCTDAKAACEDFCIGGKRLECANLLENLGGRFRLNPEGLPVADEQHKNRVYDRFKDVAERLGRLSVGWDVRAADVRAIMPMLTYSALAWDPAEFSDARRQRLLVNVLSGGKENTRRCVEVSLAVLSAVHRTCIPAALLHEQVLILGRLINVSADFRREVQEHFRLCRDMEVAPPGSFFATFQGSLHEYGWHWLEWNTLTSHEGVEFSLDGDTLEARRVQVCADLGNATQADDLTRLVEAMAQGHRSMCDWSLLTHSLREAMRQCMCANAARRRRDMKGLVEVDRDRLRTLWQKVPEADHPTLRFLMQGAAMTADREHRGTKGLVSPICSHCDMGVVEDELHRYWQCPCWTEIRRECLGDVSDELCSSIIQLPSASSVCAIPVKQLPSKVRAVWPGICSCMIAIHRRATASRRPGRVPREGDRRSRRH